MSVSAISDGQWFVVVPFSDLDMAENAANILRQHGYIVAVTSEPRVTRAMQYADLHDQRLYARGRDRL